MITSQNEMRLDAVETAWFQRENETINKRLYKTVYPANKARLLVPDEAEARGCGKVYTWGMVKNFGEAKEIANMAEDLPRAGTSVNDQSRSVKPYGASYGWDLFEIKEAARTGRPLETMEADAARLAVDNKVDSILATGDGAILGLLNQTGTTALTLGTKSGGGKTWALATPKEIVRDFTTALSNILAAMKQNGNGPFTRFTFVIPETQHILISTTPMGDGIDKTIKDYILMAMKDNVESIESWHRCTGAGALGVDRMAVYPKDPLVLGAVLAEDFTIGSPQQKGLSFIVPTYARCGGVVVRYPVAMAYGDGL